MLIWLVTDSRPWSERKWWKWGQQRSLAVWEILFIGGLWWSGWTYPWIVSDWLIATGLGLFGLGFSLAVWAKLTMKEAWGLPATWDKSRQKRLVMSGPFQFSRNPIYLSLVLMILGFGLAVRSPLVPVVAVMVGWYFQKKILVEERLLEQHFGKEFQGYKRKIRRWI